MTMFQFSAAVAGWMRAQGQKVKRTDELSDDHLRDMGIVGF